MPRESEYYAVRHCVHVKRVGRERRVGHRKGIEPAVAETELISKLGNEEVASVAYSRRSVVRS